jgi:LemA protein
MKKLLTVFVLMAAIVGLSVFSTYLVRRDEMASRHAKVDKAWSQVHVAMQRRAELVPTVLATMKANAGRNHALVAEAEQATADLQTATTPADAIAASRRLDAAIARLYAAAQDDPDLLVNHKFFALQDQWATATNRIAPERVHYDHAVQDYNAFIADFPNDVFARWASFGPMENAFSSDANAASRTTAQLLQK